MSSEERMEDANAYAEHKQPQEQSFGMKALEEWTTMTFMIPQGTGILSVCLFQLQWQFEGLQLIATIAWILSIVIYIIFLFIYMAKIYMVPGVVRRQLTKDITEVCCLSSPVITFGVIIDMVALVCAKAWGPSWGMAAYVLSWINVVISVVATVGIPYVYFRLCPPGIDHTPPVVLLPAIVSLTASSVCGIVCFYGGLQPRTQVPMIIVGYILMGLGLADAAALIFVYVSRLLAGGFPTKAQLWANFTIVGPLGQASNAIQILGKAASSPETMAFALYNKGTFITENAGRVLGVTCTLSGLMLWSYSAWWLLFSLVMTVHLGFFADGGIRHYQFSAWSVVYPWVRDEVITSMS
ncbi:MAG: hypothetical protein Q9174_001606 [Haloplaca sp. 1 TL-2023]